MELNKNLVKNIPLAGEILKNFYDKQREKKLILRIKKFLKGDLPFVYSAPPKYFLGHEPTIRCNLKCEMCYQGQTRSLRLGELDTKEVLKIYEKFLPKINPVRNSELKSLQAKNYSKEEKISISNGVKEIKLVGGEPFMRSDILELISFWDKVGKKIALQTNCTLLTERTIKELKNYKNIAAFLISLDGPESTHDKVRGVQGAYKKMMNAVRLIRENLPWAKISIFGMILQGNLKNIYELIDVCQKEKFSSLNLIFEQVYDLSGIEKTKKIFLDVFDWKDEDYRLNTQIKNPAFESGFNSEFLKRELMKLRKYGFKKKVFINFVPFNFYYNLPEYFGEKEPRKIFCMKLLNPEFRVNQKGDAVWCDVIEKSFGNLIEKSPDEIWRTEEFQKFRKFLFENSLPVCRRCCKAVYVND